MGLKDYMDSVLWQKMQDELSKLLNRPVHTLDTEGNRIFVSGEMYKLCSLLDRDSSCLVNVKKHVELINDDIKPFYCHAGLLNLAAPVFFNHRRMGTVVVPAILSNPDQLRDFSSPDLASAAALIKRVSQDELKSFSQLVRFFVRVMPVVCSQKFKYSKKIAELSFMLDFANATGNCIELHKLLGSVVDFFVKKFDLSNCFLFALNHKARYVTNDSTKNVYELIESISYQHLKANRSPLCTSNLGSDLLFKDIEGVNSFPDFFLALPFVHERELIGYVCMFSEHDLRPVLEISSVVCQRFIQSLLNVTKFSQAEKSAITDSLTGLYNRSYFMQTLKNELTRAHKDSKPTSLIIFDIDDFKSFNDTYGHPEGDRILRDIADTAKACFSDVETVCRYGGEEFVVILPDMSPDSALDSAEKLRSQVEIGGELTVSVGVITSLNSVVSAENLLKEADKALYKAKRSGKNRVVNFVMVDKSLGVIDAEEAGNLGKTKQN
ncbi:diguanylate cyclase [Candidatus Woesearchaeota archaeon]|nr:diguanylate cyclase [Candidatus Woesearchaeota archaeon]